MCSTGTLIIYNSRRDRYGNVYYAVALEYHEQHIRGTIAADNISTRACRQRQLRIERYELPIRKFNALTKSWPHFGCTWEEIIANLVRSINEHTTPR